MRFSNVEFKKGYAHCSVQSHKNAEVGLESSCWVCRMSSLPEMVKSAVNEGLCTAGLMGCS